MKTLPDLILPDLQVLFVGTNPGAKSARIGHYFAGTSNMFWRLLYESNLTLERLNTKLDYKVLEYGYGLTDVIKRPTRSTSELNKKDSRNSLRRLEKIVEKNYPKTVVFVGKTGFRHYIDDFEKELEYGNQKFEIGSSKVYLLPSTSGQSFADTKYHEKLFWFKYLRKSVNRLCNSNKVIVQTRLK